MAGQGQRTSDYDYSLPAEQIARYSLAERDSCRLMVVDRASGSINHHFFRDLPRFILPGDALVINDSAVIRARLLGTREGGGEAEVLLMEPVNPEQDRTLWLALVRPGGRVRVGKRVRIDDSLAVEIVAERNDGVREVRLLTAEADVDAVIERVGHVPLPPYLDRPDEPEDVEAYQTVYARERGSVAAPTAGLHFTSELLGQIRAVGASIVPLRLHVGVGTFRPIDVEDPEQHVMHSEQYALTAGSAAQLRSTRAQGGSIVAVGTTVVRTLETVLNDHGDFAASSGATAIFIRPPQKPLSVDALITNFHLPRSTLLMLVAAFAGYDLTMAAYREAVASGYRFYSYGDAMLVL